MHRVFLVEDDSLIQQAVTYALESNRFLVEAFFDGSTFFRRLQKKQPDIVLLDIMLPGEDGLSILDKLRSDPVTKGIPIILLTAKGAEFEKLRGLEKGADDYVTKPFGIMELVARVKSILRRVHEVSRMQVGELSVELDQRMVKVGVEEVELTRKEFDLLVCLMEHEGRVFTRNDLLDRVWGYDAEGETRTIDVHMGSLRNKLKGASRFLKTVRGVGYRFKGREE